MKKICILLLALVCTRLPGQSVRQAAKPAPPTALQVRPSNKSPLTPEPPRSVALQVRSSDRGLLIPTLTNQQMGKIPDCCADGLMVYNTDKGCLSIYSRGSWSCVLQGGGSWFSKDLYPMVGTIAANGKVLSGIGFAVYKDGPGSYHVSFAGAPRLQAVTANILELADESWDLRSRVHILGDLDALAVMKNGGGFTYETGDGGLADRPISFIALVRGSDLPAHTKRFYPLAGQVNADGSIASGSYFSVSRASQGLYRLTFAKGVAVQAITATVKDGSGLATRSVLLKKLDSGYEYKTTDENGALRDASVSFIAMVNYSFDAASGLEYNRHMLSGAIRANGQVYVGKGFSVQKTKLGTYKVSFDQVGHVLAVTANLLGYRDDKRDGVVIRSIDSDSFTYATAKWGEGDAKQAADIAVVFTAVVD